MTGGYDGSDYLDSTELYDSVAGTWTTAAAKLPSPYIALMATNINNKVLIFGKKHFIRNSKIMKG